MSNTGFYAHGVVNIILGVLGIILQYVWIGIHGFQVTPSGEPVYDGSIVSAGLWGGFILLLCGSLTIIRKARQQKKDSVLILAVLAGVCSVIILAIPAESLATALETAPLNTLDKGYAAVTTMSIIVGVLGFFNNVFLLRSLVKNWEPSNPV